MQRLAHATPYCSLAAVCAVFVLLMTSPLFVSGRSLTECLTILTDGNVVNVSSMWPSSPMTIRSNSILMFDNCSESAFVSINPSRDSVSDVHNISFVVNGGSALPSITFDNDGTVTRDISNVRVSIVDVFTVEVNSATSSEHCGSNWVTVVVQHNFADSDEPDCLHRELHHRQKRR
jgi:hypothetical protein